MNTDQIVVLEPHYHLEKIDNEITVYHPSLTTSMYLNETAALIWELCDGTRTAAEIIDQLAGLYPESRTAVAAGVIDIVGQLVDRKIASLCPGSG